jgi:glycosyltransferase involved in cell wall biosynthesis
MTLSNNPLVSVVIPSYNHGRFIGKAVQSVLDQTYKNVEIIVVDNHSTDQTPTILNKIASPDLLKVVEINNDGVIAASRNKGIREARGEWIAFLDSDDVWMPDKLEKMLVLAKGESKYEVLCHNEYKVYENSEKKELLRHGPATEEFYRTLLLGGNRLSTSATMVQREFVKKHNLVFSESPDHVTVEDYAFWLDLAKAGARFGFTEEVLGEYFIHASNNSLGIERHWRNNENLLRWHLVERQAVSNGENLLNTIFAHHRFSQCKQAFIAGDYVLAAKVVLDVLFRFPLASCRFLLNRVFR